MKEDSIRVGSVSIVIDQHHYGKYLTPKENKLFKITYLESNQDEFQHMDIISKIPRAQDYYALTENLKFKLDSFPKFLEEVEQIIIDKEVDTMKSQTLVGFFIDNAGDTEIFETVVEMIEDRKSSVWKKPQDILNFTQHIIEGLDYLHQEKICHLDVKLENIMLDSKTKKFKIIDFGYATQEPFTKFIQYPRGTPGYFPQYIAEEKISKYHPLIKANDMIYDDEGCLPIRRNPSLVYKIDSYCLGRTLYCLWIAFQDIQPVKCSCFGKVKLTKTEKIIKKIMDELLVNNIHQRKTVSQIRRKYFEEDIIKITPV